MRSTFSSIFSWLPSKQPEERPEAAAPSTPGPAPSSLVSIFPRFIVEQFPFVARFFWFLQQLAIWVLRAGPIPKHVAIIMDGNRRYARRSALDKKSGHVRGYDRLIDTLEALMELGVQVVTVYAFSIDNFHRDQIEVANLMELAQEKFLGIAKDERIVSKHGVAVRVLGNLSLVPESVRHAALRAEEATAHNDRLVLNICFSYTSREEITHAIQECRVKAVKELTSPTPNRADIPSSWREHEYPAHGLTSEKLSEMDIQQNLYTKELQPVDLLIRTSGETRLSNFMLWQASHACLAFCEVLWPEFSFRHLAWVLLQYQKTYRALRVEKTLARS